MRIYYKIKKVVTHSIKGGYYVVIAFMSDEAPSKLTIGRGASKTIYLPRIKSIITLYTKILHKKIINVTVTRDTISLCVRIFVEVQNG